MNENFISKCKCIIKYYYVLLGEKKTNKQTNLEKMREVYISIIFITFISSVMAIKCFSCESTYEPDCGEYFNAETHFKLDCNHIEPPRYLDIHTEQYPNATACFKQIYKENGVYKVVRHCYFGSPNETDIGCGIDPSLMFIENLTCHVCNDIDFCNHATSQYFNSIALFKYISLVICIKYFTLKC